MKSSGKAEITKRKADTGAKRLRATIAAMSLVALALSLSNARAQDKASPPRTEATSVEPKGYDLEITNGILAGKGSSTGSKASLTLVVDRLRESYPQANIAMPPTLGGLPIGELKLRTGSLWDELEAVRVASGGKFEWKGPGFTVFFAGQDNPGVPTQGIDPATGLPVKNPDFPNAGLFVLREARPTPETERIVEAFNIGPYLEWMAANHENWGLNPSKPEEKRKIREQSRAAGVHEIENIIMGTLSHFSGGDKPEFQFHEGANLLVLIGTREVVEIARKVLSAMPGQSATVNPISQPVSEAADEAFRRRYGLGPSGSGHTPGAPSQPQIPPGTPAPHP